MPASTYWPLETPLMVPVVMAPSPPLPEPVCEFSPAAPPPPVRLKESELMPAGSW